MKIEKIHLQILLPVLSMLKIQNCEISTNCFGQTVIISEDLKLGYFSVDDFGNIRGNIESISFYTEKDNFGKIGIFINNKKIFCREDDFGACVVSLDLHQACFIIKKIMSQRTPLSPN